jgi:hypothetical protein
MIDESWKAVINWVETTSVTEYIAWLWALERELEAPPIAGEYDIDGRQPFLHEWHQAICEGMVDDSMRQ